MVKLNKIYTRTGDDGKTSLVGGERVDKYAQRPSANGEVDELNAVLGIARLHGDQTIIKQLAAIQNDLFDLGADLATIDPPATDKQGKALRIKKNQVLRLEAEIDAINAQLAPLNSFILPGGSPLASWLHLARTVARRAERQMTALASEDSVNPLALQYINRLSDLLFVMARCANEGGKDDILWIPAQNQK